MSSGVREHPSGRDVVKAAKEDMAVESYAIDYNKTNGVPYPYGHKGNGNTTARERQLIYWNLASGLRAWKEVLQAIDMGWTREVTT